MQAFYPHNRMFNDIVFEGRNKIYGAYYLRHLHNRNMVIAIFGAIAFLVLTVNTPYFLKLLKGTSLAMVEDIKDRYVFLEPPPMKAHVPTVAQQPAVTQPSAQQQRQNVSPSVEPDHNVTNEILPPTTGELEENNTGPETINGGSGQMDPGSNEGSGSGEEIVTPSEPEAPIFFAQQMPEFPGGEKDLFAFLYSNLKYPALARENGISGRVVIQFIVSKEGKIYGAKVIKGIGGGCDQEALRAVNAMPDWRPGKHNGKPVDVIYTLPIVFQLK